MAKKLELTGYFQEIGEPKTVGDKGTKVQDVVFMLFGYQNRAQGIDEPDEPWLMQVVGKKIDELKLDQSYTREQGGFSCKITCYMAGYALPATTERKAYMGYRCNLTAVEKINPRA